MAGDKKDHWENVYASKDAEKVSWFRPHLERSLEYVRDARLNPEAAIIDVGAGASTFVDDLLNLGYANITVLDLSQAALDAARARLGERGASVRWICADVSQVDLGESVFDFWHDRAVFHFLTEEASRGRYVDLARKSLKPGGHIVVATFGPQGPEKCSGLEVVRFTPDAIHAEFGNDFEKQGEASELHNTPWGSEQQFVYCYCRIPKPSAAIAE